MVKLDDDDDFDGNSEYASKPKFVSTGDYRNRRVLAWVQETKIRSAVETALVSLLPFATVRVADSEKKAMEFLDAEVWDTFVVDLTENGVSDSNFVKRINNNPNAMLIAIHYPQLSLEGERATLILESIRRLFDLDLPKPETEKEEDA